MVKTFQKRKKITVRIIETANSPNSSSAESDDDEQENNPPPPPSGSPQLYSASEYISKFAYQQQNSSNVAT